MIDSTAQHCAFLMLVHSVSLLHCYRPPSVQHQGSLWAPNFHAGSMK
jgi:hypothetical protein